MSPSPATPVGSKHSRTCSVTQRVEHSSDNLQQSQRQYEDREWSSIPDLIDTYSHEEQSDQVSFYDIYGEDNMPYPYSKYRDGIDA